MMRLSRFAVSLLAVAALVVVVIGIPIGLILLVGWPVPDPVPGLDELGDMVAGRMPVPADLIISILAAVMWLLWVQVAWAVAVEVVAASRGRLADRAPIMPGVQLTVGKLVTAATLLTTTLAARPVAAGPLPTVAPVAQSAEAGAVAPEAGEDRATEAPTPTGPDVRPYVTEPGDTWWGIAEATFGSGTRWKEIRNLNLGRTMDDGSVISVGTDLLRPEWRLLLPAGVGVGVPIGVGASVGSGAVDVAVGDGGGREVVVERGDTIWGLAEEDLGDDGGEASVAAVAELVDEIAEINRTALNGNPDLIFPGQRLELPGRPPLAARAPGASEQTSTGISVEVEIESGDAAPPDEPTPPDRVEPTDDATTVDDDAPADDDSADDDSADDAPAGDDSADDAPADDDSADDDSADDAPAGDDSADDAPADDDSADDDSADDDSAGHDSAGHDSAGDAPAAEDTSAEDVAAHDDAGDDAAGGRPAVDEPVVGGPDTGGVVDEPPVDGPTAGSPAVEDAAGSPPAVDEPAVEDAAGSPPAVDEPAVDEQDETSFDDAGPAPAGDGAEPPVDAGDDAAMDDDASIASPADADADAALDGADAALDGAEAALDGAEAAVDDEGAERNAEQPAGGPPSPLSPIGDASEDPSPFGPRPPEPPPAASSALAGATARAPGGSAPAGDEPEGAAVALEPRAASTARFLPNPSLTTPRASALVERSDATAPAVELQTAGTVESMDVAVGRSPSDDGQLDTSTTRAPIFVGLAAITLIGGYLHRARGRRRKTTLQSRHAGRMPAQPKRRTRSLARRLAAAAEPEHPEFLNLGLRALGRLLEDSPTDELPRISGVWISHNRLVLALAEDSPRRPPPAPFTTFADGSGWSLQRSSFDEIRAIARGANGPLPLLTTVGTTTALDLALTTNSRAPADAYGLGSSLLFAVDLEAGRVISVQGPRPADVVETLSMMALELAISETADQAEIICVGFGHRLATFDRVVVVDDLSEIVDDLQAITGRAVQASGDASPFATRVGNGAADTWDPVIVFHADPDDPEAQTLTELAELTDGGVTAVCGYPTETGWTFLVDGDSIRCPDLPGSLGDHRFTRARPGDVDSIADLFDESWDEVDLDERFWQPLDEPVDPVPVGVRGPGTSPAPPTRTQSPTPAAADRSASPAGTIGTADVELPPLTSREVPPPPRSTPPTAIPAGRHLYVVDAPVDPWPGTDPTLRPPIDRSGAGRTAPGPDADPGSDPADPPLRTDPPDTDPTPEDRFDAGLPARPAADPPGPDRFDDGPGNQAPVGSPAGPGDDRPEAETGLRVDVLGNFTIGGHHVGDRTKPWKYTKTAELILYLLLHPSGASQDLLMEQLFPEQPANRPRLNQLVSDARTKALGVDRHGDYHLPHASPTEPFYRLTTSIDFDLRHFARHCADARRAESLQVQAREWTAALELVRGRPFTLPHDGYGWALPEIEATIVKVEEAAVALADVATELGDHRLAVWATKKGLLTGTGYYELLVRRGRAALLAEDPEEIVRAFADLQLALDHTGAPEEGTPDLAAHPDLADVYDRLSGGRGRDRTP